jgi:putative transposase
VRRVAVRKMLDSVDISERRACRLVGLSRTSYREPPSADAQTVELSTRIVELAHERRRFGYRRIHDLLAREGHAVNHKRVWRLYRQNNLAVRKRRKVKRTRSDRMPLLQARAVNQVWSLDFVMDSLASGRRIKCLTVVDDFSRECVDIAVDHGIGGEYVTRLLEQAGQFRGSPMPCVPIKGRSSPAERSWPGRIAAECATCSTMQAARHRTPTSRASTASSVMSA